MAFKIYSETKLTLMKELRKHSARVSEQQENPDFDVNFALSYSSGSQFLPEADCYKKIIYKFTSWV